MAHHPGQRGEETDADEAEDAQDHRDDGLTPLEYELVELMAVAAGFFARGVGLLWAVAPAATLETVQSRLDPQPMALPDFRRASA